MDKENVVDSIQSTQNQVLDVKRSSPSTHFNNQNLPNLPPLTKHNVEKNIVSGRRRVNRNFNDNGGVLGGVLTSLPAVVPKRSTNLPHNPTLINNDTNNNDNTVNSNQSLEASTSSYHKLLLRSSKGKDIKLPPAGFNYPSPLKQNQANDSCLISPIQKHANEAFPLSFSSIQVSSPDAVSSLATSTTSNENSTTQTSTSSPVFDSLLSASSPSISNESNLSIFDVLSSESNYDDFLQRQRQDMREKSIYESSSEEDDDDNDDDEEEEDTNSENDSEEECETSIEVYIPKKSKLHTNDLGYSSNSELVDSVVCSSNNSDDEEYVQDETESEGDSSDDEENNDLSVEVLSYLQSDEEKLVALPLENSQDSHSYNDNDNDDYIDDCNDESTLNELSNDKAMISHESVHEYDDCVDTPIGQNISILSSVNDIESDTETEDDEDSYQVSSAYKIDSNFQNTTSPVTSVSGTAAMHSNEDCIDVKASSFQLSNLSLTNVSINATVGADKACEVVEAVIIDDSFDENHVSAHSKDQDEVGTGCDCSCVLDDFISSTGNPSLPHEVDRINELPAKNVDHTSEEKWKESSALKIPKDLMRSSSVKRGKWTLGSKIGVGSFGVVHVGMNHCTGTLMAVKAMHISSSSSSEVIKEVQSEIELMKSLDHPNIVRYIGAEFNKKKDEMYIFQEWIPGGSICSLLTKFGPFSIAVIQSYLAQILTGLDYLHSNRILHRDIKGGNVLVNDYGIVKLADFGASKRIVSGTDTVSNMEDNMAGMTMKGTPYFMAPEVCEEKYGTKADVWSCGGVAHQMFTGDAPWKGLGFGSLVALYNHLKSSDGPPPISKKKDHQDTTEKKNVETSCSHFQDLLNLCFKRDPALRPSPRQLLQHPFFQIDLNESMLDDEVSISMSTPGNYRVIKKVPSSTPGFSSLDVPEPRPSPIVAISPMKLLEVRNKNPSDSSNEDVDRKEGKFIKYPDTNEESVEFCTKDWPDWVKKAYEDDRCK